MLFAAQWQSLNGPPAGRADDMSIGWDPIHSYWAIFAADRTHKLYKSINEGEYWDSIPTAIPNPNIIKPACVITDENNAQVVYIGKVSDVPVWWSTDGGQTWDERSGEYPNNITNNNPLCFAMDPNNSSIVYLGCTKDFTNPELFKTTDGGTDWSTLSNFPDVSVNDITITTDPVKGTWIIAGCSQTLSRGIWLSTNGGNDWNQKLSSVDIYSVNFADQFTGYAGAASGVYKTEDGGGYWVLLTDSPQYTNALKAITTDKVYAATNYGMFMTPDGGNTWYEINEGIYTNIMFSLIAHPQNSQTLFAGGEFSVYKTTDGGSIWKEIIYGFKIKISENIQKSSITVIKKLDYKDNF